MSWNIHGNEFLGREDDGLKDQPNEGNIFDDGTDFESLDITTERIEFDEIEGDDLIERVEFFKELVELFNSDPIVKEGLEQGDLRKYSQKIENELREIEVISLQDCMKSHINYIQLLTDVAEAPNLVRLHEEIHQCDVILERMAESLSGFQKDLGTISSEIKYLQEASSSMSSQLKNRSVILYICVLLTNQNIETITSVFIDQLVVSPELIQ